MDSPKQASPASAPTQTVVSKRKFTAQDVFRDEDEEDGSSGKRRRPLPIFSDEERAPAMGQQVKPMTAEEKRKCIKNLIEQIPTVKEDLFKYKFDWTMVDSVS